jgi:hypothetical protein
VSFFLLCHGLLIAFCFLPFDGRFLRGTNSKGPGRILNVAHTPEILSRHSNESCNQWSF